MGGNAEQRPQTGRAELEALWHEHRRWLAAVLLTHMPREAELEDLLQEVAVTVVSRIHELRDEAALRGWLRTVAVNTARMAARSTNVRRAVMRPLDAEHVQGVAAPDAGPAREARAAAEAALEAAQRLPEAYREPLLLRTVRGLSQRQIAQTLGVPETTIETRLARARRMLREQLGAAERPRTRAASA